MSTIRNLKLISIIFLFFTISNADREATEQNNRCKESRCGKNGPPIRFPFRLKNDTKTQPKNDDSCGHPGFDLICVGDETALYLPSRPSPSNKYLFVSAIDYQSQEISIYNPEGCSVMENQTSKLLASLSIFPFEYQTDHGYTLLKCPSAHEVQWYNFNCELVDDSSHYVALLYSTMDIAEILPDYVSCSKMYDVPWDSNGGLDLRLDVSAYPMMKWSKPDCRRCEAKGQGCRLRERRSNGGDDSTECFDISGPRKGKSKKSSFVIAGIVVGIIFFIFGTMAIIYVYTTNKNEKENRKRIEIFLEDYKAFKPSRYTFTDIKKITNQFKEKLGEGAYGTVFKGKLSNEVFVAVKILNDTFKGNGDEFINEVSTMGHIHHVNVVRLVGFCADGFNRGLVYEFLPNDSLEKYISSSEFKGKNGSLSWETLQEIALGIAKGIEYLHQGCDQRILHFDIKPHNVLLDQNFIPKIADFGMAKLCSKDQSIVSMTTARGTLGYIAPEVFSRNFGNVSYKSDVYSFGMLLLEMVGGRKNTNLSEESNTEQIYYPEWIYNLLEDGQDLRFHIDDECDASIAKKLAIVGLWCIQWHPVSRPTMKVAVQMLEGEEDLTMPPNPFASSDRSESKVPANPSALELETIVE